MSDALVVEGLRKAYGETIAVDGLDLVVAQASVVGLLGPNGAGKTTALRIFATLLRPDSGRAAVFGADVVRDAAQVRAWIGLTGQFSAVDDILTGFENLQLVGRLHRLGAHQARERAEQLLAAFDLEEAGGKPVKTYSGGMRRRLDLAASLVARPRLLLLDEPTTGLDSRSRAAMWEVVEGLRQAGTTVLLTTQYLEEADHLADTIAVIDHGHLVASGTPDELKRQVGGERLELGFADGVRLEQAAQVMAKVAVAEAEVDRDQRVVTMRLDERQLELLPELLARLRDESLTVVDIGVRRPTLDSVFLQLTGHAATAQDEGSGGAGARSNGGPEPSAAVTRNVGAGARGSGES